jgi:hypothetical protein
LCEELFILLDIGKMEIEKIESILCVMCFVMMLVAANTTVVKEKYKQHNSILTGKLYYEEIMNTSNQNRFLHVTLMDKETFVKLMALLKEKGGFYYSTCK